MVDRKEQEPLPGESIKPDYTALRFPPAPADRPYVLVNMVMSVDGKVVVEGNERGLGSRVDQRLMRELRVHADIVLNGAGTLRASGTSPRLGDEALEALRLERGKPRYPIAAIITASADLPLERAFFTAKDFDAVVYVSENAPLERSEALRATGRAAYEVPGGDEIGAMLRHMRQELGAQVLLVEGGPRTNAELFRCGCVDEYFETIGPVIVGWADVLTAVDGGWQPSIDALVHLDLLSAVPNPATSEVYLHYRVQR